MTTISGPLAPSLFMLTPSVVAEVLEGVQGSDLSIPLGDGLRASELLVRLTKLPSSSDPESAAQLLVLILQSWSFQQQLKIDDLLVRNENSRLASVLDWLSRGLPVAHIVAAARDRIGPDRLTSLGSGLVRLSERVEEERAARPTIFRWASSRPWWIIQSSAFHPWAQELANNLSPADAFGGITGVDEPGIVDAATMEAVACPICGSTEYGAVGTSWRR